jgi:hypothetical protein
MSQERRTGEADVGHAVAAWAEALAAVKALKARLLEPDPGDVREAVRLIESRVREAASLPLDLDNADGALKTSLRAILKEMAEVTMELGLIADARAQTTRNVLKLFQRHDVPPGTVLEV